MNSKVEKIKSEITKQKEAIAKSQHRIRELEKQLTEAENAELVMAIRSINVPPEQLLEVISKIGKKQSIQTTKTEATQNEV